jgi:hypothetical protein
MITVIQGSLKKISKVPVPDICLSPAPGRRNNLFEQNGLSVIIYYLKRLAGKSLQHQGEDRHGFNGAAIILKDNKSWI